MTDRAQARKILADNLLFASGVPETAFGIPRLYAESDDSITGSMTPGRVPLGPDGRPAAGAVGVLADDALGFSLMASSPDPTWSVSVEITLDFLAELPRTCGLHVTARGTMIDQLAGYGEGRVVDDDGRLLVTARQHGRYVAGPESGTGPAAPVDVAAREHLTDLLGATTQRGRSEATLRLADPQPWLNPMGALHGGVAICAAEAAAALATSASAFPLRTTSMSISFARPMAGPGPFEFVTRVLHAGRTVQMVDVVAQANGTPCTFARVVRQVSHDGDGAVA